MIQNTHTGTIGWACPSNIALIKYWGKRAGQIPMNSSLSMTLQEARTLTRIRYSYAPGRSGRELQFRFEGRKAPSFEKRIAAYLDSVESLVPVLAHTRLEVDTENSFPHSSGMASSASAMGALALCLVQLEEEISGPMDPEMFRRKASGLARLGSGSASRSLYPGFALWGRHDRWEGSSDEYAVPVTRFHETFQYLRDAILLVDTEPKKVSSSAGHALLETNPFRKVRFQQARENLDFMLDALEEGDWKAFISLLEEEALTLHALMMTGRPGYLLMKPATLSLLRLIREYREETGYRLGFSLDAGANVHLLYAGDDAPQVESFIRSELLGYCENGRVLMDRIGQGPKKLSV
jgi:diphosphomevalonate decarboxylase